MKSHFARTGFSLVELLVVCGIIGVLAGLLLPALATARFKGRVTQCRSNLRQTGMAISDYSDAYRGLIPVVTSYPTNKLWNDADGTPDSLGVLVTGGYLEDAGVLFCPLQPENDARRDGRRIGVGPGQAGGDVYGSYVYRQHCIGSGTFHMDSPGRNPLGRRIQALALDSSCPPWPRIAHSSQSVNILFYDGSVLTANNERHDYSVMDLRFFPPNAEGLPPVMAELQKIFVTADATYGK